MESTEFNNQYLVYVKPITKNIDNNTYEYDFIFSETPEIVWGSGWDDMNPSTAIAGDLTPDKSTYNLVQRVITNMPLKTIEETSCYSMEYAINGAIALAWIDIENLEEYPENGRMVLHYEDSYAKVQELLNGYNYEMKDIK